MSTLSFQEWEDELRENGSVRLGIPTGRTVGYLAGFLLGVVVGILMTREDGVFGVLGWLPVVVFGLAIPVMVWRLATGRPFIIVTADDVSLSGRVHIPWRDVVDVRVFRPRGASPAILLRLSDAATQHAAIRPAGWEGPLIRASNAITKGPDVSLPAGLRANQELLAAWLSAVNARWHVDRASTDPRP